MPVRWAAEEEWPDWTWNYHHDAPESSEKKAEYMNLMTVLMTKLLMNLGLRPDKDVVHILDEMWPGDENSLHCLVEVLDSSREYLGSRHHPQSIIVVREGGRS